MKYLIAPSKAEWPTMVNSQWFEADSFDVVGTLLDLRIEPAPKNTYIDHARTAYDPEGNQYRIYQPTPRLHQIHGRNLCCDKAVVLPCMCVVAYACPEHRPDRQQCVGSHD